MIDGDNVADICPYQTMDQDGSGWTVLHGDTPAPTDVQVGREVAELRRRVVRMLTTLFGDEAFAHTFAGPPNRSRPGETELHSLNTRLDAPVPARYRRLGVPPT